jgi:hypothetical protein
VRRIQLAALLVGTLLTTGAWTYPQPPQSRHEQVDAEINAALHDLAQVEYALHTGNPAATERELGEIRARLNAIRALMDHAQPSGPTPIAPQLLDRELRRLSMTWDVRAKLAIVGQLASGNYFTVAQVVELTQVFYGQREKIEVIETLAPRIVDPQDYGRLNAVIVRPEARERLAQIFARRTY